MKIYLDTSSLFKLYHREVGTDELEKLFSVFSIRTIFLSEIAKVEFASTLWKKVRMKEISESSAIQTLDGFGSDFDKFTFVQLNSVVIETAKELVTKYGGQGLRTLDSIQLATAVLLRNQAQLFKTSDKLLEKFLISEGLSIEQ